MTCGPKAGTPKLVKREKPLSGPSPPMTGLVDSGNGLVKDNIFISDGTPTLLPEFIKKYLPGNISSSTCINNKLTATPTI